MSGVIVGILYQNLGVTGFGPEVGKRKKEFTVLTQKMFIAPQQGSTHQTQYIIFLFLVA